MTDLQTEHTAVDDLAAVSELLDNLMLGDEEIVEAGAIEELVIGEDTITEDEVRDLDLAIERNDVYENQESVINTDTAAPANAKKNKAVTKSAKGAKATTSKPSVTRTPRDLATVDAAAFVLEGEPEDLEANKAAVMLLSPKQVKVAEKFENIFASISVGKQPSVYVVQAFKLLDEKKEMTSIDLTSSFKVTYKQGTAMSQAGQIMHLFDILKIATRTKNALVLNENSVLAAKLREILKPAA